MGQGVYTPEFRFEFVKGWLTGGTDPADGSVECGDGTAYPLEVTLDQLAEIMYRVKKAHFISGFVSEDYGAENIKSITASSTAPSTLAYAVSVGPSYSNAELVSGYCTYGAPTSPIVVIPQAENYLGSTYDRGDGAIFRDIADSERGVWLDSDNTNKLPRWNVDGVAHTTAFSLSFSLYVDWADIETGIADTNFFEATTQYGPSLDYMPMGGYVQTWGEIAIVKLDPLDGFFASTNRFFLKIDLLLESQYGNRIGTNLVNIEDDGAGYSVVSPCNYVLRLSSGDVSCPLYLQPYDSVSVTGGDFVHSATEWWPYAKGSPAAPVWNVATGEKL